MKFFRDYSVYLCIYIKFTVNPILKLATFIPAVNRVPLQYEINIIIINACGTSANGEHD